MPCFRDVPHYLRLPGTGNVTRSVSLGGLSFQTTKKTLNENMNKGSTETLERKQTKQKKLLRKRSSENLKPQSIGLSYKWLKSEPRQQDGFPKKTQLVQRSQK